MIKTCKQCQKEYEAIRDTSIYCSPQCRKLAFLKASVPEEVSVPNGKKLSVPRVSVLHNKETHDRPLTLNEKQGITEYGKCHACKKEVSHLICICRDCTTKDITHKSLNIDHC